MSRLIGALLFWTLILCACTTIPVSPQPVPLSATDTPFAIPTTAVPPDTQNCGYQWAYQDLPELSSSFQQSIRALQPDAQAYAFAFGENCILNDGSVARFIPMETDFNITLPVGDAASDEQMGEWIVKIMQVIEAIPTEQILGPRPGRVSIMFQSDTTQRGVNFYRDQYQALPPGLSNAEIYQTLQSSQ
ncbi:MAG TPA: hypothetical protein VK897_14925 [Anaerolineales bacterium]|nr:hypothetical protein [Anaerolineales bacterium]